MVKLDVGHDKSLAWQFIITLIITCDHPFILPVLVIIMLFISFINKENNNIIINQMSQTDGTANK